MFDFLKMKSFGPYIRNGKLFWRNYRRPIKRTDAKTFLEIEYLGLPIEFQPLWINTGDGVQ